MSQETNLNVAPYFDDFNEPEIGGKSQDYYKVLFKPGQAVQARELTTLQSMLQNQVEQFGNHFFKEGAKVIPGDLTYIDKFYAVEVEDNFSPEREPSTRLDPFQGNSAQRLPTFTVKNVDSCMSEEINKRAQGIPGRSGTNQKCCLII